MSEQGERESADEQPGEEQESHDEQSPPPAGGARGPWLLLLLLLVGVAAAGYFWVEQWRGGFDVRLAAGLDDAEQRVAELAADNAALVARLDELGAADDDLAAAADDLAARFDPLADAQDQLEDSVKALYAREAQASLDWVLAEVEYLVFAATQRLALEGDVDTAIEALKAADARLRAAQHPDLIGLREQLAGDIGRLEAVPEADVEGLAIFLADAVRRSEQLPTKPIADLDMSFSGMTAEEASHENWQGMAKALWADLKSLVEVKDGKLEDGVLFDPKLRYFLRQNLRLELASARLALLKRDQENFRAALTLVIDLLDAYYDTEAAGVSALRSRLEESLAVELAPPIPSVSASLDAVRSKRSDLRDAALAGPSS
ncbi:MAG: uroporphyrinogen-III C-methyltransferase [Gammaproteobacteria bacterium]